jgi:hypothetical protein
MYLYRGALAWRPLAFPGFSCCRGKQISDVTAPAFASSDFELFSNHGYHLIKALWISIDLAATLSLRTIEDSI